MPVNPSLQMNAYVLCGGASRRMGEPKCNLRYGPVSYVQHVANLLAKHFNAVYAVGKEGQQVNTSFQVISDNEKNHHPLWGVATAMSHSQAPFVFIVACDLIFLSSSGIETLLHAAAPCYAKSSNSRQPLLGIYPTKWLKHTINCAETNESVLRWADNTVGVLVDNKNLRNVNYPWERP